MNIWKVELWSPERRLGEVLVPSGEFMVGRPPEQCRLAFPRTMTQISERCAVLVVSPTGMVTFHPVGAQILHVVDHAGASTRVPDGGLGLSGPRRLVIFNGGRSVAELVFHRIPGPRRLRSRAPASGTTRELGLRVVPDVVDNRGEVTWELVALVAAVLHRRHQRGAGLPGGGPPEVPLTSQSLRPVVEAVLGQPVSARILTARLSSGHTFFAATAGGTARRREGLAVPLAQHVLDTGWASEEVLDEIDRRISAAEDRRPEA